MQVVKENTAFESPRERLSNFFSRGDIFYSTDFHLCFVCGGADPEPGHPPTLRRRFLDWAAQNAQKLVCVQAESAVTDLLRRAGERRKAGTLSDIESTIAETVDSLLLFPESPGSFAELGMFSVDKEIAGKMLVTLLPEHQVDSFLMLGPIRNVSTESEFSPVPWILTQPLDDSFGKIAERLLGGILKKRGYRRRFTLKAWKKLKKREQIAVIDCLVYAAGVLTEEDLFFFIGERFGSYDASSVRLLVGLLVALDRVAVTDDADMISKANPVLPCFIESEGLELSDVKAVWMTAYGRHLPDAVRLIREVNP
ncbi:hypothetical protein J2X02_001668 [Pseudoxanthomonas japonensis]|uniref:retron St85 family effector protein n=1 Tax=Pseudoxanthomonas japonensis TaxID=69284 RepID=UPI002862736D|nr:retron St85 family effector protein [Pseudoxanthomonas japonensis]MDR7068817.1 hypothetical protein [Pseudoxanthomonas japonensis]